MGFRPIIVRDSYRAISSEGVVTLLFNHRRVVPRIVTSVPCRNLPINLPSHQSFISFKPNLVSNLRFYSCSSLPLYIKLRPDSSPVVINALVIRNLINPVLLGNSFFRACGKIELDYDQGMFRTENDQVPFIHDVLARKDYTAYCTVVRANPLDAHVNNVECLEEDPIITADAPPELRQKVIECMDIDWERLTEPDKRRLKTLLWDITAFTLSNYHDLAPIPEATRMVQLTDYSGFRKPVYRIPVGLESQVKREIERLLDAGIMELSTNTTYRSSFIALPKASGRVRCIIDLREINKRTKSAGPCTASYTDSFFSICNGKRYFSTLDLSSAFYHIPLDPACRDLFTTEVLGYNTRMCRLVLESPGLFSRLVTLLLSSWDVSRTIASYVDDLNMANTSIPGYLSNPDSELATLWADRELQEKLIGNQEVDVGTNGLEPCGNTEVLAEIGMAEDNYLRLDDHEIGDDRSREPIAEDRGDGSEYEGLAELFDAQRVAPNVQSERRIVGGYSLRNRPTEKTGHRLYILLVWAYTACIIKH